MNKYNKYGFSIIELTISLVIISLLITLSFYAKQTISNLKIKNIIAESTEYKQSINDFYKKYKYLPGDFDKSDKFFGIDCDPDPQNCNGDGNGLVNYFDSYNIPYQVNIAEYSEPLLFWRHLSLGNYIKGQYTGKVQDTYNSYSCNYGWNCCFSEGENISCPASSTKIGQYSFSSWAYETTENLTCNTNSNLFLKNQNILLLGKFKDNDINHNSSLTAKEAYLIDKKIDDSIPTRGIVQSRTGYDALTDTINNIGDCIIDSNNIAVSNHGSDGENYKYNISKSGRACIIGFVVNSNSLCETK